MSLPTARLRPLIQGAAYAADLPWWMGFSSAEWLEGLVLQESGGNPMAMRYEAHLDRAGRPDSSADGDEPGQDDGLLEDDRSYGLCQVMGYNIRKIVGALPGVHLNFGFALRPLMGMALGCRVLVMELEASDGNVSAALARYNGGPSGNPVGGPYRTQGYVDGVLSWAKRVKADKGGSL